MVDQGGTYFDEKLNAWKLAAAWTVHLTFMGRVQTPWIEASFPELGDETRAAFGSMVELRSSRLDDADLLAISTLHASRFDAFHAALIEQAKSLYAAVVQVDPKELAQSISRVGSREETTTASVEVAYLLNAIEAGADAEIVLAELRKLHAIQRMPLLVGFGAGRRSFGWISGPRFGIDEDGEEDARHIPSTQGVSARVAVPLLWKSIELRGDATWLAPARGSWLRRLFPSAATSKIPLWGGGPTVVDLPLDPTGLESLLRNGLGELRGPRIFEVVGDLREGAPNQEILILGQDICRR